MVALVVFSLTLKTDADEAAFFDAFKKLQAHTLQNEPGTLTYELHQCVLNGRPAPRKYCVVERYTSTSALEDIHLKSPAFGKFFTTLGELGVAEQSLAIFTNDESQPRLDAMPLSDEDLTAIHSTNAITRGCLVFGGARHGANPSYTSEARELGAYIAEKQLVESEKAKRRPLVYGGGTVGIMGEVAQAVKAAGGVVISVIPNALRPREASGEMIGDIVYFTNTMADRKSIMLAHSDTVVAMPGGVGTFDELLEVITLFQLNACRPKIGLVNVNGFFDPFLSMLDHLIAEGFVEPSVKAFILVDSTARGLMAKLEVFELPVSPARTLVWHSRP